MTFFIIISLIMIFLGCSVIISFCIYYMREKSKIIPINATDIIINPYNSVKIVEKKYQETFVIEI
jgi:hypothetical protein